MREVAKPEAESAPAPPPPAEKPKKSKRVSIETARVPAPAPKADPPAPKRAPEAPAAQRALADHSNLMPPRCTCGLCPPGSSSAAAASAKSEKQLASRQEAILARIAAAEARLGMAPMEAVPRAPTPKLPAVMPPAASAEAQAAAAAAAADMAVEIPACNVTVDMPPDGAGVYERIAADLKRRGVTSFATNWVPSYYYEKDLAWRQHCLGAHTLGHLCKSIVIENTKAHQSVDGIKDPLASKYYVVIVQYAARMNADKLRNFVYAELGQRKVGKKNFNMRLAPEEVSAELTGYVKNGVVPVAMRQPVPVILSHRILDLSPRYFWMGGGHVDFKLAVDTQQFVDAYKPFVTDCTYDDLAAGEDLD
ncbi:unnamed protein product [Pedinophyceae sp. YPF-701]|nr:unnamed protein product [Pedinophyceae sp. YPF-701]